MIMWLEQLDNKGNPTGHKEAFSEEQANAIFSFSRPMWRKCEPDSPLISRNDPRPAITEKDGEFIEFHPKKLKVPDATRLIKKINDIETLESGLEEELNSPNPRATILEAIKKRVDQIKKENKK